MPAYLFKSVIIMILQFLTKTVFVHDELVFIT